MKSVVAIIKPFRMPAVLEALGEIGPTRVHTAEVRGYGRQKGHLDAYDGGDLEIEFIPKIRLEFEIEDLFLDAALCLVRDAARTGRIGDGKIFVFDQLELDSVQLDDLDGAAG